MDLSYKELYQMNPVAARLNLVRSYEKTHNITATAKEWHTSRHTVRKWVRRYAAAGKAGLADRSHTPRNSPRRTPPAIEQKVIRLHMRTGYGRLRLAWLLARTQHITISPNTIRHILRRHAGHKQRRPRKTFYPAHWAWSDRPPFALAQVDTKDIMDKATLGTALWTHIGRCRLKARSRSRQLTLTNGLAFSMLVMLHLRACGIKGEVVWQTDWGTEFGGSNPHRLKWLQERYFAPLGARLARYPKGRKEYNGRVERSHRTDDEEFYLPCLAQIDSEQALLAKAAAWVYYYNYQRPHQGAGMEGKPPFTRLEELLGRRLPRRLGLLPPLLLDTISSEITLLGGNDLLAIYTRNP